MIFGSAIIAHHKSHSALRALMIDTCYVTGARAISMIMPTTTKRHRASGERNHGRLISEERGEHIVRHRTVVRVIRS